MSAALLERARRSLEAAGLLVDRGLHADSVTRAYYAAFHSARAALLSEGEEAHTHKGTHSAFNRLFVHPGRLPTATGRALRNLHDLRLQADYDDGGALTEAQARDALDTARAFVEAVAALIDAEPPV